MTNLIIRCILAAALLVVCFCAKPNQPEEPSYFVKTPMPDELAELTALYLSGEILAPQGLYDRVHRDLEIIRDGYATQYSMINENDFRRHFRASCFFANIDTQCYDLIAGDQYTAWDSLNVLHELEYKLMDSFGSNSVQLVFAGRRHPKRLIDDYLQLPGFIEGHNCPFIILPIDVTPIYAPRINNDSISYLFMRGSQIRLYFVSIPDSVYLVGLWNLDEKPETPEWWLDGQKNWDDLNRWINEEP